MRNKRRLTELIVYPLLPPPPHLTPTDLHSLEITSPSQGLGFTAFRSLLGLLDTLKANRVIPYIPPFIITRPRLLPLPSDQASAPTPEYKEFATQRAVRFFRKVCRPALIYPCCGREVPADA